MGSNAKILFEHATGLYIFTTTTDTATTPTIRLYSKYTIPSSDMHDFHDTLSKSHIPPLLDTFLCNVVAKSDKIVVDRSLVQSFQGIGFMDVCCDNGLMRMVRGLFMKYCEDDDNEGNTNKTDAKIMNNEGNEKTDAKIMNNEGNEKTDAKIMNDEGNDKTDAKIMNDEGNDKTDKKIMNNKESDSNKADPKIMNDEGNNKTDLKIMNDEDKRGNTNKPLIHDFTGVNRVALSLAHTYSRSKVEYNIAKEDNVIIQAVESLQILENDIDKYTKKMKEMYGYHFPELAILIYTKTKDTSTMNVSEKSKQMLDLHLLFCICIQHLGNTENNFDQNIKILEKKIKEKNFGFFINQIFLNQFVSDLKKNHMLSIGTKIEKSDHESICLFNTSLKSKIELALNLHAYITSKMVILAPNLTKVLGNDGILGARLISKAGGISNLSKVPSSTFQLLGAEKALFRALKAKSNTPKYGLIYNKLNNDLDNFCAKNKKYGKSKSGMGKLARFLAAKCVLAVRIDFFGNGNEGMYGHELGLLVNKKIESLFTGQEIERTDAVMKRVFDKIKNGEGSGDVQAKRKCEIGVENSGKKMKIEEKCLLADKNNVLLNPLKMDKEKVELNNGNVKQMAEITKRKNSKSNDEIENPKSKRRNSKAKDEIDNSKSKRRNDESKDNKENPKSKKEIECKSKNDLENPQSKRRNSVTKDEIDNSKSKRRNIKAKDEIENPQSKKVKECDSKSEIENPQSKKIDDSKAKDEIENSKSTRKNGEGKDEIENPKSKRRNSEGNEENENPKSKKVKDSLTKDEIENPKSKKIDDSKAIDNMENPKLKKRNSEVKDKKKTEDNKAKDPKEITVEKEIKNIKDIKNVKEIKKIKDKDSKKAKENIIDEHKDSKKTKDIKVDMNKNVESFKSENLKDKDIEKTKYKDSKKNKDAKVNEDINKKNIEESKKLKGNILEKPEDSKINDSKIKEDKKQKDSEVSKSKNTKKPEPKEENVSFSKNKKSHVDQKIENTEEKIKEGKRKNKDEKSSKKIKK